MPPCELARTAQKACPPVLLLIRAHRLVDCGGNTSGFGSSERDPDGVQVGQMRLTAIFSCSSITSVFPAEASAGERRESAMMKLERSLCLAVDKPLQCHGQGWPHRAHLHVYALWSRMGEGRRRRGSRCASLPVTLTVGKPMRAVAGAGTTAAYNLTRDVWV